MNLYSIYKVTNKINQKVYIGFSKDWKVRKRRHKSIYKTHQSKFYTALKTYGWDNFEWEEIYTSTDKDHCYLTMEQYFINQYDSINNGYNIIQGGTGTLGAVANKVWINNGSSNKRADLNCIPEGWVVGRLKIKRKVGMSDQSKKTIGEKNRSHQLLKSKCPNCDREFNAGNLSKHLIAFHS